MLKPMCRFTWSLAKEAKGAKVGKTRVPSASLPSRPSRDIHRPAQRDKVALVALRQVVPRSAARARSRGRFSCFSFLRGLTRTARWTRAELSQRDNCHLQLS